MRSYTKNNSRQEVKKEVEKQSVVSTKSKKKIVEKTEEQNGDLWEEKQGS